MKIRLLKPHAHAGKDCIPGEEIEVTPRQAEWLINEGIAESMVRQAFGVSAQSNAHHDSTTGQQTNRSEDNPPPSPLKLRGDKKGSKKGGR